MKRLWFFIVLITVMGCQEEKEFEATVTPYPNPFLNYLNIEVNLEKQSDLAIWIAGMKEMSAQTSTPTLPPSDNEALIDGNFDQGSHSFQLDMSEEDHGIFVLDVSVNGVVKRFRLIKQDNR